MNERSSERTGAIGGTGKLLVSLGAALGAWQILTAADPGKAAVQVLMAAGAAVLVALLLFGGEITRVLRPPLYTALVVVVLIWLVLAFGSTQWGWNLLPG